MTPRTARALLASAAALALPALSHATNRTAFISATGTSNWTALTWSPSGIPLAGDNLTVTSNASSATLRLNLAYPSGSRLGNLTLASNVGPLTFSQSTSDLYAASVAIASTGTLVYSHTGSALNLSGDLTLAPALTSSAAYALSSTASLAATNEYIAQAGTASFSHTGGTNTLTGYLNLASAATGTGTYSLSGATSLLSIAGDLNVGQLGTGSFVQSAGTLSQTFGGTATNLGNSLSSTGSYSLSGGSLLTLNERVGADGNGTFTQSAGTHSTLFLILASAATSTASYTLTGGSLSSTSIQVGSGGTASFAQSAGTHTTNSLLVGFSAGSTGSYSLTGGTLSDQGTSQIALNGTATFTQSAGTHTAANLFIGGGNTGTGTGTYSLAGPSSLLSITGNIRVGGTGKGTLLQSGGTLAATGPSSTFAVAALAGSTGSYTLSAGTLTGFRNLYVGGLSTTPGGTGTLAIAGGSATFTGGAVKVFPGSTLQLTGGSLTVDSLDLSSHPENFAWIAGSLSLNADFTLDATTFPNATLLLNPAKSLTNNGFSTNNGTILLQNGSLLGGGTITNNGTISGAGAFANSLENNSLLNATGSLTLASPVSGTGTLFVGPAGSLTTADTLAQSILIAQGTVTLGAPASIATLLFPTPAAGSVDLLANPLTLTATTPNQIRQDLLANQLRSSTAAADPQHRLALGYLTTGTTTLVKSTYLGDANLDGKVNADDYALLDRGFAQHATIWQAGDFNYDGIINNQDYLLIDRVFTQQGVPLSPDFLAQRESQFGAQYVSTLLASIPEPSAPLACGFAIPYLSRRRPS